MGGLPVKPGGLRRETGAATSWNPKANLQCSRGRTRRDVYAGGKFTSSGVSRTPGSSRSMVDLACRPSEPNWTPGFGECRE